MLSVYMYAKYCTCFYYGAFDVNGDLIKTHTLSIIM